MRQKTFLLAIVALGMTCVTAFAQEKKMNSDMETDGKSDSSVGMQYVEMGYSLAMLADRQRSATLMLAAAELLGGMKQSDGKADFQKETKGDVEGGDHTLHDMSFGALLDRALEYADETNRALVEAQVKKLRSGKGLAWKDGKDFESLVISGVTFKILDHDVIEAGQSFTYRGLNFEGGEPAVIGVIGNGGGDIDLWIHDGGGDQNLITKDTSRSSQCVVEWFPKWDGPFIASIENVGKRAEEYMIIANW